MQKRFLRYLGALLVSLVTTYSGLQRTAAADSAENIPCSLSDVTAWQISLEPSDEEASPAYIQRVTEDFIARCPTRPEIPEAHRIAAMAASWDKNPEAAAEHFDKAGQLRDTEALMMHAAARLAVGDSARAWALRDKAVETWISRTLRRKQAHIDVAKTATGRIITVSYDRADPDQRVSNLWIGVPDGEGWPAALSISSQRQLTALYRLRAGEDAAPLHHVRLYRCERRRLLARTQDQITQDMAAEAAEFALSAYLAAPDVPETGKLTPCLFTGSILPDISPSRDIALQ